MAGPASGCRRARVPMHLEYLVGGILSLLLTVYLVYALIKPERF